MKLQPHQRFSGVAVFVLYDYDIIIKINKQIRYVYYGYTIRYLADALALI